MTLRTYRPMNVEPPRPTLFATIAEALDSRRQRQQQVSDNQQQHTNTMELSRMQMGLSPEMQAIQARKEAQALQLKQQAEAEAQSKAQMAGLPDLQASMGDPDKAAAMAGSLGINDMQRMPETESQQAVGDFFGDMNALGGEQAAADGFGNQKKLPPRYSFTAGGKSMEMGASDAQSKTYDEAAADLGKYSQSESTDSRLKDVVGIYQGQLVRGEITPEKAAAKIEEAQLKFGAMSNQKDIAGMRKTGAGRGGPKASDVRGDKRLDVQIENGARVFAQSILSETGFKAELGKVRQFSDIGRGLESGNALSDAAAKGTFVKIAQGGTGVISDSDMNTFWHKAGSLGVRGEDQVMSALNGKMGEEKRQLLKEAVRDLAMSAQRNMDGIRQQFRSGFARSKNYADYGSQMEETYFGPDPNAPKDQQQAAPGSPAQRQPANAAEAATMRRQGKIEQNADDIINEAGL